MADFAKLMGAGDKGEYLFDVGHYKKIKNSSRNKYETEHTVTDDHTDRRA